MDTATSAAAWAELAHKGLPPAAMALLLRAFGAPEGVLAASRAQLSAILPSGAVDRLLTPVSPDALAHTVAWLAVPGNELIAWDDPDYPQALLELGHAPPVLYFTGQRAVLNRPALAIVGSRNATPQGMDNATAFAQALSAAGFAIVSGLAQGIDAAAHVGAMRGAGSTIAVVGTGLDRVYPKQHRALAHAIAAAGGMLSEFAPGTPPLPGHFPRRNRLIAGLARGVLVVEAALSSGSLITARLGGEAGREVFAIPGSIHSPLSRGCHPLIRDGAKLVETAQDILDELQLGLRVPPAVTVEAPVHPLLEVLGDDPADVDTLCARTAQPAAAVLEALVLLELDGRVTALPGGRWQQRRPA